MSRIVNWTCDLCDKEESNKDSYTPPQGWTKVDIKWKENTLDCDTLYYEAQICPDHGFENSSKKSILKTFVDKITGRA